MLILYTLLVSGKLENLQIDNTNYATETECLSTANNIIKANSKIFTLCVKREII